MADFRINVIVDPSKGKRGIGQINKELSKTEDRANRLRSLIGKAFAFGGIIVGIKQLATLADAYTTLNNRIKIVTDSAEQQAFVLDKVFISANRARQPVAELAVLYQRVSTASKELGASQEEVLKFVDATAQALAIQGGAAAESKGALLQLSQALGNANIQAQEFNSLVDGAFPLLQAAARGIDAAGGSVSKLRQLVLAGNLSNKEFFQGILSQADALEKTFGKTVPTISQAFVVLRNNLTQFVGEADTANGISRTFAEGLILLSNNLTNVVKILAGATAAFILYKSSAAIGAFTAFISTQINLTKAVLSGNAVLISGVAADKARAASSTLAAEAEVRRTASLLNGIRTEELKSVSALRNIRLVQTTLIAERELEVSRLQAQISAIGRQQSLARLAELRLAEVAIIKQVEAAEKSLIVTKLATTIAEKKVQAATVASTAAHVAQGAVMGTLGRIWAGFLAIMRGALNILGGIPGLIITVASAFLFFGNSTDELTEKLENLDSRVIDVTSNLDKLSVAQATVALNEFKEDVIAIDVELARLQEKFKQQRITGPLEFVEKEQAIRAAELDSLGQKRIQALEQITILENRILNIQKDQDGLKLSKESLQAISGLEKLTTSLDKRSIALKNNKVELIQLRIEELAQVDATKDAADAARKALATFQELTNKVKAQKEAAKIAADAQRDYNAIINALSTPEQQIALYNEELNKLARLTKLTTNEQKAALDIFKEGLPIYQEGAQLTDQFRSSQERLNEEIKRLEVLLKAGTINQLTFNRALAEFKIIANDNPLANEIALLKEDSVLLRASISDRQLLTTVMQLQSEMQRVLTDNEIAELDSLIKGNQLLQAKADVLESIVNPQEEVILKQQAINELYNDGEISLGQFVTQLQSLIQAQAELNISNGEGSFSDGFIIGIEDMLNAVRNFESEAGSLFASFFTNTTQGFADATVNAIVFGDSFKDAIGNAARQALADMLSGLVEMGIQFVLNKALSDTLVASQVSGIALVETATVATQAVTTASSVAAGTVTTSAIVANNATIATSAAPAAALESTATFGGAAIAGLAALAAILAFSKGFADGGNVRGAGTSRSDSIPAMLSNGEFVVNAKSASQFRPLLEQINSPGAFQSGGSVGSATPTKPQGSSSSGQGVKIVNVLDPGLMEDFLGSAQGEKVFINSIERNSSSIKQLLGNS